MLSQPMRRLSVVLLCLLAVLAIPLTLGACGGEEEAEVVEGEQLHVGELYYNVQITRFLNPEDVEDAEYLVGQPPAAPGTSYLGVFMVIGNESEEELNASSRFTVHDTLDTAYEPLESESPYALLPGSPVPAEGQLPLPDSTADFGPNQGSLLIFSVPDEISENRPLRLEIESYFGVGEVELDI